MITRCPICGSERLRPWATCRNTDDEDVPCLGLSDTDAALQSAHDAFARDEIDLAGFERRVEIALSDPPRRRFSTILEYR